jgi:drug/metabolite transporter (DMT)-like permease
MSLFTNIAWISYSLSTVYIPIGIATSISESYIAFASLLGIIINKEKLKKHQIF